MKQLFRRMMEDRNGQNLVEYGMLAAVVAIGSVAALKAFSSVIGTAWTAISANLSN
jgi:Flp pilus assembly pilin Flp